MSFDWIVKVYIKYFETLQLPLEKGGSLEQSAEINEAARNLKCNHKRGLHLWTGPLIVSYLFRQKSSNAQKVELNNIQIAENETAASADRQGYFLILRPTFIQEWQFFF